MRATKRQRWDARLLRLKRLARRVRDVFPVTALGVSVGLAAGLGLRSFAFARLDLVWLVVAYALLGLLALDVLLVVLGALWLKLRLRAPARQVVQTQTETPTATGFRPPRWAWVPLVRVQHEVVAPERVTVVQPLGGVRAGDAEGQRQLWALEWLRFERRGQVRRIERRVVVSDVLGLAQLALRVRQDLTLDVLPHPGALERMPVLTAFSAGDEVAHPLGATDGDRVELRRYQPGDPARFIHWKIYARTGKLLVRQPERALTQTTRTVAYLLAGPRDEASAAAARVAIEQGALGDDWLFGAAGTPTPVGDLPSALDAIVRSGGSGDTHPGAAGGSGDTHAKASGDTHVTTGATGDTHPNDLASFLSAAEAGGPARVVVFAPALPPGWVSSESGLPASGWVSSILAAAAERPGRLHVVLGVDGVSARAQPRLTVRFLRTAPEVATDDLAALMALRALLAAAGVDTVVVDRRSGEVLGPAHLSAAREAA
jgi:hypothetical protein